MSKKHKKRKKTRRERKGQPQAAASTQTSVSAETPAPAPTPATSESPAQPTPRPAITATFKPTPSSAAQIVSGPSAPTNAEEAEYTSVRKDLRKLGFTIIAGIAVVIGLVILNDQTGFVGTLGEQLFHLWE